MAKTYLSMTNELLVEINEPEVTTISGALGIQKFVANCVNRAYFDIVDAQDTALEDRYNAQISEADATLKIYLENSVGIGEHPQHIDEVDKLIEKIANAEEKLIVLQQFKL